MHNSQEMSFQFNYLNKSLDIPPRKLLSRRGGSLSPAAAAENMAHMANMTENEYDFPRVLPEEILFKKFLPYNSGVDSDEDADPYAADHFRMYEFKVRKCTRSRSHDWTDCPFAHPGEKARRRCPRRYSYLGTVCADFRRGNCSRGDLCEFAHGVFECWLHPSRYRTEACKDGKNCQRKICFFAHTQRQLRVVPTELSVPLIKKNDSGSGSAHCCKHCRCHLDIHHTISPTSTLNVVDLDVLSPPVSPPFSPARSGAGYHSPVSRFADRFGKSDAFCMSHLGNGSAMYKDSMNVSLNELMRSMGSMTVDENEFGEFGDMKSPLMEACFNSGVGGDRVTRSLCGSNVYAENSGNGPDLGVGPLFFVLSNN